MKCRIFSSTSADELSMKINTFLSEQEIEIVSTIYKTHGSITSIVSGDYSTFVGAQAKPENFSMCIFYNEVKIKP